MDIICDETLWVWQCSKADSSSNGMFLCVLQWYPTGSLQLQLPRCLLVACWLLKIFLSAPEACNSLLFHWAHTSIHAVSSGWRVKFKVASYCLSPLWPISDLQEKLIQSCPVMLLVEELFVLKVVLFHSALLYWANLSPVSLAILMSPVCRILDQTHQIIPLKPSFLFRLIGRRKHPLYPLEVEFQNIPTTISRIILFPSHFSFDSLYL